MSTFFFFRGISMQCLLKKGLVTIQEFWLIWFSDIIGVGHHVKLGDWKKFFFYRDLINFARENDDLVQKIARRGFEFVRDHLRSKDIFCYWKKLLRSYQQLLRFEIRRRTDLVEISWAF